jgi:putative two-component system response regulator
MPAHDVRPPANILIVDDDARFRGSLGRILAGAGYICSEVANGAEARDRLDQENDIAAMLCDGRMSSESGLNLVEALAADFPGVVVLMTTGVDDPETAALAFEIGAYGYLIKPFTANEILITLAGALRRRELETTTRDQARGLEQTVTRLRTLHSVLAGIEADGPGSSSADEKDTVERLSRAVYQGGDETGMHIERMSRFAALLSKAVGFRDPSGEQVRLASAMHDVGKIGIPNTILMRPGALSPQESSVMQRHTQIGYQLLAGSASALLTMAAAMALGHHEWWDGGGYPRGLHGEENPLEARIAAVADMFDTLTSDRVGSPALPVAAAMATMTDLRGRQFEPRLLDAFVASLDQIEEIRVHYPDRDDEPPIRVLVVDDHQIFVQSLVRLLDAQASIAVVGTAATAGQGEKAVVACEPDVVLMDFDLPDRDGANATEAVKALRPEVKVVMLTGRTDQRALIQAIGAGCAGFVAKTEPIEKLIDAIHSVHHGETPSQYFTLPSLLAGLRPTSRGLGSDLGPRELEVLRLMAAGLPNKALAERLYLSLNTVRNHVQHILYKLGVHSKLEAVATAVREGLIERDNLTGDR